MASRPFVCLSPPALARGFLCALVIFCSPLAQLAQQGQARPDAASGQAAAPADAAPAQNPETRNEKLSGLSVILKVESMAGDPVFYADGYRIRITTPGTITTFTGGMNTVADVKPGTWIHFEGVRDKSGVVMARTAKFYLPGTRKAFTAMGPKNASHAPDYKPVAADSLLDANGRFVSAHGKVRYSDSGGPCGWHRVPADAPLQERVRRIGTSVVPEYQKQLSLDAPSRISFRFYAVSEGKVRSAFACNDGLVLVPENVVERLKKDDQLAAVLAEAVAFHLRRQLSMVTPLHLVPTATDVAQVATPLLVPAAYIAGDLVGGIVGYEVEARIHRECARVALQLIANAGYDPWQAPEAWRILAPKDPPQNVQSLEYTGEGKLQLNILKMQYKEIGSGGTGPSGRAPSLHQANSELMCLRQVL